LLFARAIAPSPDGRWLAFNASYRSVRGVPVQQSKIFSLLTGELHDLPVPRSSADSSIQSGAGYADLFWLTDSIILGTRYRSADSVTSFWVVPIVGNTVSKVAFESKARMSFIPRLAPDGSKIAFSIFSDDPNAGGIWTMENFLRAPKKGK